MVVSSYSSLSFNFSSASGYLFSRLFEAFTLALTVVVVAVPEGLPMMIAVVLSSNVRRMARDGVLVKKAVGIEAAGSMDLLFTDKTGTLTEGNMSLDGIIVPNGEICGSVSEFSRKYPDLARLFALCALCNTSAEIGISEGREVPIGGNPTDRALIRSPKELKRLAGGYEIIKKLPFDSVRKFSAV